MKGAVRSMADRSGTYMGDERPSGQDRLAESFARGRKPDCLDSNERGSLLYIFVIAYDAVRRKCR